MLAALAVSPAHAANVPPQLVDANAQVCVRMDSNAKLKALDKYAPADASRVPAYCSCLSKAYWASVPQADYDGMMAETAAGNLKGPHSLAIQAAISARNEAAKKSCQ